MLIGELVFGGETVFTPGVPRGGSKGVFAVNALTNSGTETLNAVVEHKNYDEIDSQYAVVTGGTITVTSGIASVSVTDIKEQIRLRMTASGSGSWIRTFVFEPSWEE